MEMRRRGPAGEAVDTPSHRALASASRVAILRLISDAPDGLTTGQVAAATGLHLTTARAHLDRLTEAKLLVKSRAGSGGAPGRPAWRYRAAAAVPAPASYRGLAAALLDNLAESETDARGAAIRVGQRWGRSLAATAGPGRDPAEVLEAVLDELGFAPQPVPADQGRELHLPVCPFLELVATNPDTTCALHLGVVRGVLQQAGGDPAGTVPGRGDPAAAPQAGEAELEPFGAPNACVVRLPRPRGSGGLS